MKDKIKTKSFILFEDNDIRIKCDKVYSELVEPLTVKPISGIKGTTQLFENEEQA